MTWVIRPGRGDITTTRWERKTASGIEWVTNTTAALVSAQIRISSACMRSRVISSSAPNGSSMSSSAGRRASARAIATRCCMPPESWLGRWAAKSARPTSSSSSSACARRSARPSPCRRQRQLDVALDGAPLQQPGLLEGDAVVLVEAGLPGRLAVDRDRARRSARSGWRRCAAASTCRSPTVRSARRTRPRRRSGRSRSARRPPSRRRRSACRRPRARPRRTLRAAHAAPPGSGSAAARRRAATTSPTATTPIAAAPRIGA